MTLMRFPSGPRGAAGKLRRAANLAEHISEAAVIAARTPRASAVRSCAGLSPNEISEVVAVSMSTVPLTPKIRGAVHTTAMRCG